MLTPVAACLLLECLWNHVVDGEEFVQTITEPTPELCDNLYPPNGTFMPALSNRFLLFSSWLNPEQAMVFLSLKYLNETRRNDTHGNNTKTEIRINGWIVQARVNNVTAGTLTLNTNLDHVVLDCPPGYKNTLTGVYESPRKEVAAIWVSPKDLGSTMDVTFRVSVLTRNRTFCVKETVLSHEERLLLLEEPPSTPDYNLNN